jgi:hypothetical protein
MSVIEAALVTLTCTRSSTTSVSGSKGHATFLSAGAVLLLRRRSKRVAFQACDLRKRELASPHLIAPMIRSTVQASDLPDPTTTLEGPPKPLLLQHPKHRPL